jgi:flagellar hook protein FlgE
MSFQQGLSGLNAASKTLEAIGNNVANSGTVGFKSSQAQFADVFASSLSGSGGGSTQVGIGVKVSQVAQAFTQGNVTATSNPLDLAINGGGFFRMSTNGTIAYSRNGQFQLDKNGFIVNANGSHLTGYTADGNGVLSTGKPEEIQLQSTDLPPKFTDTVKAQLNLDSTKPVVDGASGSGTSVPFSRANPTSYTNATSVSVFDSLGVSHVLQTFFIKTGPVAAGPSTWDIYASVDDAPITGSGPTGQVGTLTFKTDGLIDTTATTLPFSVDLPLTDGAATPLTVKLDYAGTTQYGSDFSVNALKQDGYASGRLAGFNTGKDGIITGRYTNGQSTVLGQVVLANFANVNGLQPLGDNLWAESSASGVALVSTPNTGSLGVLQASSVEDSNVDLTAELVNMITAQRVYQANAQTIKTQDQVLQTLVNLR